MKHLAVAALACLAPATVCRASDNPWNGTWRLDSSRAEPDGAADDYAFKVTADGQIRWEIPSLHEVNIGRLDGSPMPINRPGAPDGLSLSVWPEGPRVLHYKVALRGTEQGQGRMTLAQDGNSWTDVPLDHGKPVEKLLMVYVRR